MEGELGTGGAAAGVLQIILFDLILSGDNAVVIGVVASRLHGRQRRLAIVIGAGAAVVLRVSLATIATLLLNLPALAAVGGVLLLWVGVRLLKPEAAEGHHREAGSLREAIQLIILADVVMSLDNVLTVASAAQGNVWLLVFGLALSIPLLFVGAQLIAVATQRAPIIIYAGSALIFRIALVLILEDAAVRPHWEPNFFLEHILPWIAAVAGPAAYVIQARLRGRPIAPIWTNLFVKEETAPTDGAHTQSGRDGG